MYPHLDLDPAKPEAVTAINKMINDWFVKQVAYEFDVEKLDANANIGVIRAITRELE